MIEGADVDAFVGTVLAWGLPQLRDLPWRRTRDPWAVLVAEVMLQQTQVARVLDRYATFVEAFPNPAACASASLGDVLQRWSGLGYPRRARNLQAAARVIVDTHHGVFPRTIESLLQLPGVGRYTARAVLVFAMELPEAVVDTNIARVLARVQGTRLTAKSAQAHADRLVPTSEPWAWNQVMMDLGATRCRPVPHCDGCPAAGWCAWHRGGHTTADPAIGSAGVSTRQAAFSGSDRQARGRLIARLLAGPIDREASASVMSVDPERAARLVEALITEGLVVAASVPATSQSMPPANSLTLP